VTTEIINIVIRSVGSRVVRRQLEDIGGSATGAARGVTGLQTAIVSVGVAAVIAATGLVRMLDTLTGFENRLRLVTSTNREFNDVQAELFAISARTRSDFETTAQIYTRTALSVRELGISQQQTLAFTESLNQAVILSGANAREANAALIQLSQGLASDRLSGDELRSVLEQLPFVADIIADSLGVTRGELRKLGTEGKLTGQIILEAFRTARREINDKFLETVPTISQAFNVLRTNLLEVLDALDDTTDGSAAVAYAIIGIANSLEIALPVLAAFGISLAARFASRYIAGITAAIASEIRFQMAVQSGSVVLLNSARAEQLRSTALLASATAQNTLSAAKVRALQIDIANFSQNIALIRQEQSMTIIDTQRGLARSALTGHFVSYSAAVEKAAIATRLLTVNESLLATATVNLTAAQTALTGSTTALAAAQARAAASAAAAATFGATLIRLIPGLGLVVAAFTGLITLLGGPLSAAFIAIFILMSTYKSRAQQIEESNRAIEATVYAIKDAYDSVGESIADVTAELAGLTEIEVLRQMEDATDLLTSSYRNLSFQLLAVSTKFVAIGDEGRIVLQFLQGYRQQVNDGTIDTAEFRRVLDTLAQGSGGIFQDELIELIELSRGLDDAREGTDRLDAVLAVLAGTATAAQRSLLGLGNSADTAAGQVRNLGNAAFGTINALRTLQGFIPELARANQIQENLTKAQNVYRIGVGVLNERMAAGVGSVDQYAESLVTLEETYNRAVTEINGTAAAQRDANAAFEKYNSESALLRMNDRARAIETETRRYNELVATLQTGEDATSKIADVTAQFQQRLAMVNAEFDALAEGGASGGAAKTVEEISDAIERKLEIVDSLLEPLRTYSMEMEILNQLLQEGTLNQDQFSQSVLTARIRFLESQTTMQAGFERGFLKIIEQTADAASAMENIVTTAFDGMSSAIADLVVDGTADFGSLIRNINKMIIQLVVSQAFQQLFGGKTGLGGDSGGTSKGLFGAFSGFLGGIVDSVFGIGAAAIPGAAAGGSFQVGPSSGFGGLTGHDNRLVPLRLQDGEHVEITPRGQEPGGGRDNAGTTVIFNVTTPDAQSFQASQSQLASRAARMISSGRRNM